MSSKIEYDVYRGNADRSLRLYLRTLATTALRMLGQFARGLAAQR